MTSKYTSIFFRPFLIPHRLESLLSCFLYVVLFAFLPGAYYFILHSLLHCLPCSLLFIVHSLIITIVCFARILFLCNFLSYSQIQNHCLTFIHNHFFFLTHSVSLSNFFSYSFFIVVRCSHFVMITVAFLQLLILFL